MNSVILNTIKKEGPLAFYKGISSPLMSLPLINAIVFGTYSTTKSILSNNQHVFGLSEFQTITIAAFLSGFLNSFVCSPIELFKTKL